MDEYRIVGWAASLAILAASGYSVVTLEDFYQTYQTTHGGKTEASLKAFTVLMCIGYFGSMIMAFFHAIGKGMWGADETRKIPTGFCVILGAWSLAWGVITVLVTVKAFKEEQHCSDGHRSKGELCLFPDVIFVATWAVITAAVHAVPIVEHAFNHWMKPDTEQGTSAEKMPMNNGSTGAHRKSRRNPHGSRV
jgi:hypothetical protein